MTFGMPTLIEAERAEMCAALCHELGLDFIELSMSLPSYTLGTIDPPALRDIASRYGIFYTIHLDENVNFADFNPYIAEATCRYIADSLRLAVALGIPTVNMHFPRGEHFTLPDRKVDLYDLYREHYLTRMYAFRDLCEQTIGDTPIRVCIENCNGYPPFQQEALEILLASPVFGLTFDVGHDHAVGGADAPFILAHKQALHHMHLHDALGKKNHLALGSGELDIDRCLSLAEEQHCRVVLETKTIDGLRGSVQWLRARNFL